MMAVLFFSDVDPVSVYRLGSKYTEILQFFGKCYNERSIAVVRMFLTILECL
jgi:hypothetical protein